MIFLKRSKKYLAGTFNLSNKSRIIHFNNIIYYFICDWQNAFYGKGLVVATSHYTCAIYKIQRHSRSGG